MSKILCLVVTSSVVLFSWFITSAISSEESANDGPKCKTLFTFGYGYRQFFHLPGDSLHQSNGDMIYMRFQVKARSDAHILLSPNPSPEEADPVYEIVLGAGKNSFSDIRRKRRASTKSSAYTKDILSGTEMKGFWVRITSSGMILVGNEGDDLPFMQWQDPDPLLIEYFSFCTWSGVAGKWLYDCGVQDQRNGSIEVQPILTATDRLRQALLTGYDVFSRPVSDSSEILEIGVQLQVNHITLDPKSSIMSVGCILTLEWYDQKMVWNPGNFSDLTLLNFIKHEIWRPALVHFNAAGKNIAPWTASIAGMRVTSDGKVRWSPPATLQSRCQMNLRQWPWDTHTCSVHLGIWQQPNSSQLLLLENGTKLELQHSWSEWEIDKLTSESVVVTLPKSLDSTVYTSDDSDDDYSETPKALKFTLTLRRLNVGYVYILVIPLIVMVVMSLACFWMEPLGKEKLATNCLLLVLLCGFLVALDSVLPAPVDHIPFLFGVYSWVVVVVACATVVSVLITSLVNTTHLRPPPRVITSTLSSPFISCIFCLSPPAVKRQDYGQLSETGERSSDGLLLLSEGDNDVDQCWALVASFCDRLAFLAALVAYTAIFVS
ncbi:acetylcholine receptor subunit beta-type lev-1-like [Macrosteles quadrilineatus]|uniref:acetylcholine receptor subunit beta-type lev-1-like n=1 Tax=Macrosteles quadrilineatus TaxID=74068 RepID=UPI0023E11E62|nr:acetylcholine receptor subunit beta-type lev-1-like [Macrosteles quadrilineatus]